jgi:hypothetical protein
MWGFKMTNYFKIIFCILLSFISIAPQYAQNNLQKPAYSLRGKVVDGMTSKPVSFAIVIIQEANIFGNTTNGGYYVVVPKPGKYTVQIQSQGLQPLTTTVTIEGNVVRDFVLNPVKSSGGAVTIRGERDIQKISSQTMTVKQIKEVPGTFGDSISALSSLPGVNRPGGMFGPLIIRGADSTWNGYYIDDIPLFKTMHFGGLHSVINNDIIREIDLYSSAFPSQFGNSQAAIININTIDDVKKIGGNADIGLLSSNALIKAPVTVTNYSGEKPVEENRGYIIASARYGYLSLVVPTIAKTLYNKDISILPRYWDYQYKAKYEFNSSHSITFLAFGNKDYWDITMKSSYLDSGADPELGGASFHTNDSAHSQGLYYTFKPGDFFQNTLMAYSALNNSVKKFDLPQSTNNALRDVNLSSKPYIFGMKDKIKMSWWKNHGELRSGLEFAYYNFAISGKTIAATNDSGNTDSIIAVPVDKKFTNKTVTWYIENKFTFGGLLIVPGIHSEYLSRTHTTTYDPRGLISYTFDTGTTIGAAGGWYSMFLQTSPSYFTSAPDVAGTDLKPQRSIHRSLSLEQKVDKYTFKAEGYYNNFWNSVLEDSYIDTDGNTKSIYRNCAKYYAEGIELLAKISDESEQGLFGWTSYTYNRGRYISHQSTTYSQWGESWLTSPYDMTHVIKAVAGYTFGSHTLSTKFTYNTALPYTPIVGSYEDTAYEALHPGKKRIAPIYGKLNTERLDPEYSLDIRYTYKTNYQWGYLSWYVEFIGAIKSKSENYTWDYRYAYELGINPKIKTSSGMDSFIIPNFGVEVKF